jgi:hypothetical protein
MSQWPPRIFRYDPASRRPLPRPRSAILTVPPRVEVLRYIRSRIDKGQPFPSCQEIADHMGWKHISRAHDTLYRLAADGYLLRDVGRVGKRINWKLVG